MGRPLEPGPGPGGGTGWGAGPWPGRCPGAPILNNARVQLLNLDRSVSRALDLAFQRSRALDRVCARGVAGRLGISSTERLAMALLDGAMDDFTNADLTHISLADADLTGVRWSLPGTIWPPGTDVKALLARSEEVEPGGSVLVVTRRGIAWPPQRLARRI
jgi:hypothetical protein